jgi:hypothetical protein
MSLEAAGGLRAASPASSGRASPIGGFRRGGRGGEGIEDGMFAISLDSRCLELEKELWVCRVRRDLTVMGFEQSWVDIP